MESHSNKRINDLRRLQLAKSQASKLNRFKEPNPSGQFSSRRGSLPPDSFNRRAQRRNQFRNQSDVRRYNNLVHRNANPLQKAILKREQMKRQQQLRNRQKMNSSRMRIGASSVSRNGDQYPPPRYNRRLNQRRDDYDAPSYDSPPNGMQNHYDREYSNTFNEPFPSPHKKPFEPPNIFTQGHPGETRYWEENYDDPRNNERYDEQRNNERLSGNGKSIRNFSRNNF